MEIAIKDARAAYQEHALLARLDKLMSVFIDDSILKGRHYPADGTGVEFVLVVDRDNGGAFGDAITFQNNGLRAASGEGVINARGAFFRAGNDKAKKGELPGAGSPNDTV